MNKKIAFILISLMLVGCSSNKENINIPKMVEDISSISDANYTKYTVKAEGHVVSFNGFASTSDSIAVPDGTNNFGQSYLIHAPVRITPKNFYPDKELASPNDIITYTFGQIEERLTYKDDPNCFLEYRKEDDGFVFSVQKVSKVVNIYNVITDNETGYSSTVKLYSRFNIELKYGKDGLLMEEKIKSADPVDSSKDMTIDCQANYEYEI